MKAAYGLCLVCEKDLMTTCPTCGHKKPGAEYTEVTVDLTNKSKMPLAVCLNCKDTIHQRNKKAIMDAVKEGWRAEQVRDKWPKEKMEQYEKAYQDLEIV